MSKLQAHEIRIQARDVAATMYPDAEGVELELYAAGWLLGFAVSLLKELGARDMVPSLVEKSLSLTNPDEVMG